MDLIPGYPNYLDPGYQFPDTVSPDQDVTNGVTGPGPQVPADRQRSLSGDRVVILPRRPSESEPEWSPGPQGPPGPPGPQPGHGHQDRLRHPAAGPGVAPEWRVPPHYPPESLYPGK